MKQKNKVMRMVATTAMAIALLLSMAMPAMASTLPTAEIKTTPVPTTAAITKVVETPMGTTLPASMPFKFKITPVSVDTDTAVKPPAIGDSTITVTSADKDATPPVTAPPTDTYTRESAELFGIYDATTNPAGVKYPHAGVYEYKITETAGTYSAATPPPAEDVQYSKAEYDVFVYVINDGVGGLKISAIGVVQTKYDDGTAATDAKIDPTPGGDQTDYFYSQMVFTNTYVKTNTAVPTDPTKWTALAVGKTVTGDYADLTKYFEFTMTVTAPYVVTGNPIAPAASPTYKAYVVDASKAVVTSAANYAGTIGADGSITFASGTPLTYNLKDGQHLVFVDTPVGAQYELTETGATGMGGGYIATATVNGVVDTPGVEGEGVSVGNPDPLYVVDGTGSNVGVTNDLPNLTPTGIIMKNLPIIIMITVLALGLVGFVVFKIRRAARYSGR